MVLLIVMAIAVISLGFVARMDTELVCGDNTLLRIQLDQLAESGLEHARGLILHPQDVPEEFWTAGAGEQQLLADSRDYYDILPIVKPDPADHCTYDITCEAYRLAGGQKTGQSRLAATLRLDPCIALGIGASTALWRGVEVYGDVHARNDLINEGLIDGDVFAAGLTGAGDRTGQLNPQTLPEVWPTLAVEDFTWWYGGTVTLGPEVKNTVLGPYDPPRICKRSGDLILGGNATIDGMLLVQGTLTVRGAANVITAGRTLPALYVTQDLVVEKGASLEVTGLAVAGNDIRLGDNATVRVVGALFGSQGLVQVQTADDGSGNGNTATLHNTPLWQSAGRIGGALQLDGIDDYGRTADSATALQLTGDYSLSVWIKPNDAQKSGAGILAKTNPSGTDNHWTLQFNADGTRLLVCHPSGAWDTGITRAEVADGNWHHVVIIRKGSNMASYLDPAGSSPAPRKSELWAPAPGNGNGHLNLGADRTASEAGVYGGLLDEIRIYSRALKASEVSSPAGTGGNAPIGHWAFDENAPSVTIIAEPRRAAVLTGPIWSQTRWTPAAGGFFRSIWRP